MELPKIKNPEALCRYRGNTPSNEITQFIKDTSDDVSTLFAIVNENTDKLNELQSITTVENRFLYNRLLELEQMLAERDDELSNPNKKIARIELSDLTTVSLNDVTIDADTNDEYSQIIPAHSIYTPKLYLFDSLYNKNIIPPSLKLTTDMRFIDNINGDIIDELNLPDIIWDENNIENAIDGNLTTCWQRCIKVPTDAGVSAIDVDIIIPIPYEIISNRYINTISICPHPIKGVEIKNVQIKNGDTYMRIPGFTDHSAFDSYENSIINARPIRFFFNETGITEVKITLRQTKCLTEDVYDVYYLGAYNIEVGYTKCMSTAGNFSAQLILKGESNNTIHTITSICDNKTLTGEPLQYEIYYLNENDIPVYVSKTLPVTIPSQKLLLIGKVIKSAEVIPAIHSIIIEYDVVT